MKTKKRKKLAKVTYFPKQVISVPKPPPQYLYINCVSERKKLESNNKRNNTMPDLFSQEGLAMQTNRGELIKQYNMYTVFTLRYCRGIYFPKNQKMVVAI